MADPARGNPPRWPRPPLPPGGYLHHYTPQMFPMYVNPDERWVNQFSVHYLQSQSQKVDTTPNIREVRETLYNALRRIRECKHLQEEMNRFAATYHEADDDMMTRSRSKLQFDQRHILLEKSFATLKDEFNSFFGDAEKLKTIQSMAKRIQKKKQYRQKARKSHQAQRHIQKNLQTQEESKPSLQETQHLKPNRMKLGHLSTKMELLLQLRAVRKAHAPDTLCEEVQKYKEALKKQQGPVTPSVPSQAHAPPKTKPITTGPVLLKDCASTMEKLAALRMNWDQYLVSRGGSRIPPTFVDPPQTPTAEWLKYAEKE